VDSPLESWGDCEPIRGIHCLQQPAMGRLHNTRNAGDVLLKLAEKRGTPLVREKNHPATYRQWLEERWTGLLTQASQEKKTRNRRDALRHGVIEVPVPTPQPLRLAEGATLRPTDPQQQDGTYVWTYPSIFLYDGRGANRGWLQEAPDPMSTVVWGSWVDVNPQTARELGLSDNSGMGMRAGNEAVEAPARITDDVAPNVVALPLGQGHSALGRNARKRGVNGFVLTADAHGAWAPATLSKSARTHKAVACSATDRQFERDVLQWIDAAKLARMKPGDGDDLILPLPEGYDPERDMYPKRIYEEHRWAMVIDLQRCNGCGACAVACYAENNIPVVGKQNVAEGREMAWLKVVPYRAQNDTSLCGWLPMLCQHCDAAPCEPVCPVFASVHNEEGLNAQVYNRCVGTRYCSNNCPYKVRRFNWINTTWQSPLDKQLNPEVSARCRGVMEKCTFCIQRIRAAEFTAKRQNRDVRDGEIRPACAQSCPTRAIVFGDLLDPHSRVSKLTRNDPRRYHVLEEINTKPAVTYLRRIAEKPRVPET
jgi:molybdopterin-containing oxidoreductase family iron-sulfur binding subunit